MKKIPLIIFFLSIHLASTAQIVGGELFLTKINKPGYNYRLGLTNYFNGSIIKRGTNYSNYYLRIYRKRDDSLMARLEVVKQPDLELTHANKACEDSLGIDYYAIPYYKDYYLDPDLYSDPGGYFIKLDECCRQYEVNNVIEAHYTSIVYYAEFPSLKDHPEFSSPAFQPPTYQVYCLNTSFSSDFGASPENGLNFEFKMAEPLQGYTTFLSPTNPKSPSLNYNPMPWVSGYNKDNVFKGSPTLKVDPNSGVISGYSLEPGNFIFAIEAKVSKGGEELGLFRRDFVVSIVNCDTKNDIQPVISSPGKILTNEEIELCGNETVDLEADFSSNHNYLWLKDGLAISTEQTISVKEEGLYKLIKTPKQSCASSNKADSVRVVIYNELNKPFISLIEKGLCEGDTSILQANKYKGYQISWLFNSLVISTDSIIPINKAGNYILQASSLNCPNITTKDTLYIDLKKKPALTSISGKLTYCPGDNLSLLTVYDPSWTYIWYKDGVETSGSYSNELVINEAGKYEVVAKEGECLSDPVNFTILNGPTCGGPNTNGIYFPAAFSPNKDIHNEEFRLFGTQNLTGTLFEFTVYNQWGEVIYQSFDKDFRWDGYFKGKPLPAGAYPYKLNTDNFSKTGRVELLR